MNDPDDAQDWRDMAQHLIEAHGADSGGLIDYAPTLEQLRFAHPDTHIALASIGAPPPDRRTYPLPVDAGWYDPRPESCCPQDWPAMLTTRRQAGRPQNVPCRVDGCTTLRGLATRPRKAGPAQELES